MTVTGHPLRFGYFLVPLADRPALTARIADGWVPSFRGDFAATADMTRRLEDAAAAADRDLGEIRRVLNVSGTVTDGPSSGPLDGPVDQWVDELGELAGEQGFDTFVFDNDDLDQLKSISGSEFEVVNTGPVHQ